MAKIMPVELHAAPRIAQTSATSAARAPPPPSSVGNHHAEQTLLADGLESLGGEAAVAVHGFGELFGHGGGLFGALDEIPGFDGFAGACAALDVGQSMNGSGHCKFPLGTSDEDLGQSACRRRVAVVMRIDIRNRDEFATICKESVNRDVALDY